MSSDKETITVRVNVEIPPEALEAMVRTVRDMAGKDERGRYQVDTADAVGAVISRFLGEKGFSAFAMDPTNYSGVVVEAPG
jgi:hypothetical protein